MVNQGNSHHHRIFPDFLLILHCLCMRLVMRATCQSQMSMCEASEPCSAKSCAGHSCRWAMRCERWACNRQWRFPCSTSDTKRQRRSTLKHTHTLFQSWSASRSTSPSVTEGDPWPTHTHTSKLWQVQACEETLPSWTSRFLWSNWFGNEADMVPFSTILPG